MTHEMRTLARALVDTSEAQVRSVVRLIDAMAERGEADDLLAPLRPRLAQIRPRRSFNFTRLLFTPLDGVIVPGPRWRPGALAVPRPALTPLAGVVRARLGNAYAATPQLDDAQLAEAGGALWPAAAEILACATAPPGRWRDEAGLPDAAFAPLARGIAAVLRHGTALLQLTVLDPDPLRAAVQAMVADTARRTPDAVGLLAAVLLARVPAAASHVLAALSKPEASLPRIAVDDIIERTLDDLRADAERPSRPRFDLVQEAASTVRLATTLDALENGTNRPDLQRHAQEVRRDADAACRERFSRALESELLGHVGNLPPDAEDAEVAALEDTARDLRQFERAGRRLGGGPAYDTALKSAAVLLASRTACALPLVDRARLVEILLGADAALALLHA